jgi:hypothetical protein
VSKKEKAFAQRGSLPAADLSAEVPSLSLSIPPRPVPATPPLVLILLVVGVAARPCGVSG